jgi:hypothetical protein
MGTPACVPIRGLKPPNFEFAVAERTAKAVLFYNSSTCVAHATRDSVDAFKRQPIAALYRTQYTQPVGFEFVCAACN